MTDLNRYIEIPYKKGACGWDGCNCYGLLRLFYRHEKGIELPALEHEEEKGGEVIADWINKIIAQLWEPTESPVFADGVAFDISGRPRHIGIIIDRDWMLHVERGADSCIEKYTTPGSQWQNNLIGFFRYVG